MPILTGWSPRALMMKGDASCIAPSIAPPLIRVRRPTAGSFRCSIRPLPGLGASAARPFILCARHRLTRSPGSGAGFAFLCAAVEGVLNQPNPLPSPASRRTSASRSRRSICSISWPAASADRGIAENSRQLSEFFQILIACSTGETDAPAWSSQRQVNVVPSVRRTLTVCGARAFGSGFPSSTTRTIAASARVRGSARASVGKLRNCNLAVLQHLGDHIGQAQPRIARARVRHRRPPDQAPDQRRRGHDNLRHVVGAEAVRGTQRHDAFDAAMRGPAGGKRLVAEFGDAPDAAEVVQHRCKVERALEQREVAKGAFEYLARRSEADRRQGHRIAARRVR